MKIRHWKTVSPPNEGFLKVTSICWSSDGKKFAVSTSDRVVTIFDHDGNKKDKFSTKPSTEKGPKTYIVKQMSFSPSSDRLAIAQSDNIVFVYKIGSEWGEKKSICNKFQHSSPVNCLVWPPQRNNEVIYGLTEGKIKMGDMKSHKAPTLYSTDSYVTAIACNRDGNSIVSAHQDGSIYTFCLDDSDRGPSLVARHSIPPFALAWGKSIVVAGSDNQVIFYNEDGGVDNCFDLSDRPKVNEFTCAAANPTGDAVILGNFDSLYLYNRSSDSMGWEETSVVRIEDMYSVTALEWKPDGGKLVIGTVCGLVDLYEISLKRQFHKGKFEITQVSPSQVVVRNIETNSQIVARSKAGYDINKTMVHHERYVVSNTPDSLIVGDMDTALISEIKWKHSGKEKFIFDNESVCVVYSSGEIFVIEYGSNDFLGYFRTSYVSKHVFSLRIVDQSSTPSQSNRKRKSNESKPKKYVAYLIDLQTICVKDLQSQNSSITINHDMKIDWLMLNEKATMLLYRDKGLCVHLYHLANQSRVQLVTSCSYVQWVPHSDVIVAQSKPNLCIWYNINSSDQVTIKPIKGDVEEIERGNGKTIVIVDEGIDRVEYPLDEALISFSTAIDEGDAILALSILDHLELVDGVEEMWRQLYKFSIDNDNLPVAIKCATILNDPATATYLSKLNETMEKLLKDSNIDISDHYYFRAKMALLRKDLATAEQEYLNHDKVDECIEMYQSLFKYESAIRVAEQTHHPNEYDMKRQYYNYLLETKQFEVAAQMKEKNGDYTQAIDLYLKGNMPAKAARIVLNRKIYQPITLLDSILQSLNRQGLHDISGEFYEFQDDFSHAIDSYERGNAYRKAVELARKCFPGRVVELQEKWGDYLVSQRQIDMALNHYIEAKAYQKAIEAALSARQYNRALQLVKAIDEKFSKPYYLMLARYYEESSQIELAEKCFIAGGDYAAAVNMHANLGNWEIVSKLASAYMNEGEIGLMYLNHAQNMESQGRLKDAEKLYLSVRESDMAISMYKKHKRYDEMIRLVKDHRPELLKETHQYLAHALELEGSLRDAESHYIEASEWQSAVNMYRSNELWDDCIRVAKSFGGIAACKRMTLAILLALGVPDGSKYLIKHGLIEASLEHATETGAFDIAFEVATQNMISKLPEVHLKHALFLEDNEKFEEAEKEFIAACKPKEAIEMYMHIEDWPNALRVAENYDPPSIPDIHAQQGKLLIELKKYSNAEEHFLIASQPELALEMYKDVGMFNDAMRIAQMHLPHKIPEVTAAIQSGQFKGSKQTISKSTDIVALGKSYEQSRRWAEAIDLYMTNGENDNMLYERAIEIARSNLPNKVMEISVEVSRRLVKNRKEEQAANILFEVGRFDDAITICLTAKKFDKAKELAKGNSTLSRRVKEAYENYLADKGDAASLVDNGRVDVALDVLASNGEWDKLWDIVNRGSISTVVIGKFVMMRINELLATDKVEMVYEAVRLLHKRSVPTNESSLPVLKKLTRAFLSIQLEDAELGGGITFQSIVKLLRESLYKITLQFRTDGNDAKNLKNDLYELLMSAHYHVMMYTALSIGAKDIAAKCAISLLKFPFVVPQDKLFYQAGALSREIKNTNLAFMLLNRYVDISESIDSHNGNMMDDSEYLTVDAIPLNGPLPTRHCIRDEQTREEVRTWVLSVVTDASIEQRFPSREQSRGTLYEGMFTSTRPACIITGYPVHPAESLEVNNSVACRKDWNAIVSKTHICPWTSQPQNPIY